MSVIVVGVDGSEESREALRWAIDEAHLRQATLRAVHVWTYPVIFAGEFVPPDLVNANVLRDAAQKALDETVAEVAGKAPEVYIERVVEHGSVAHVLVEAARKADLLVVGSRGHGGFAGSLLGSVSQQCAHHAPCAVVIIRSAGSRTNWAQPQPDAAEGDRRCTSGARRAQTRSAALSERTG